MAEPDRKPLSTLGRGSDWVNLWRMRDGEWVSFVGRIADDGAVEYQSGAERSIHNTVTHWSALNRRSVTSQASEGAGSRPVWTDAQIESMARELCSFRGETPHAVDRGGVEKWEDYKPLAKTALDQATRIYASPLKRVERLETALRPFADCVFNDNGDMTISGTAKPKDFIRAYFAIHRPLQGGRS